MSDVTPEAWLTQETTDLLDQGPVGLYEFIWGLNGAGYGLTAAEAIDLSSRVARQILHDQRAQLFAVEWPTFKIVSGPLKEHVLDDPASWSEGEQGPMIALIPVDDIEEYRNR